MNGEHEKHRAAKKHVPLTTKQLEQITAQGTARSLLPAIEAADRAELEDRAARTTCIFLAKHRQEKTKSVLLNHQVFLPRELFPS